MDRPFSELTADWPQDQKDLDRDGAVGLDGSPGDPIAREAAYLIREIVVMLGSGIDV